MEEVSLGVVLGGVALRGCVMNASGCWCTEAAELDDLQETGGCAAVVTKSGTAKPRSGNPAPRLRLMEHGSINSMGIPNHGYRFYASHIAAAVQSAAAIGWSGRLKPFVQSIHPASASELGDMLDHIASTARERELVEVNLSCPNLVTGDQTGLFAGPDLTPLRHYLRVIRRAVDSQGGGRLGVGLKLPALYYGREFDRLCAVLLEFADAVRFVTTINSVSNGLVVDVETRETAIHPREGLGGIGGLYCKPVGLANVANLYRRLGDAIQIVGCGGVASGADVLEYVLCGAMAVQIGTTLLRRGPACFSEIDAQLRSLVRTIGFTSIQQLRGQLKIAPPHIPSKL